MGVRCGAPKEGVMPCQTDRGWLNRTGICEFPDEWEMGEEEKATTVDTIVRVEVWKRKPKHYTC